MKKLSFLLIAISVMACNQTNKQVDEVQLTTELNQFMDNWHLAAAETNEELFFGKMSENAIYIGTDAGERWTKEEFYGFAKPYFDKGSAWDFKATSRNWAFSDDYQYAWFDELLDTWMGVCRSSGVLKKHKNGWLLEHYHLSVTVPNDVVRDFVQLVEAYESN